MKINFVTSNKGKIDNLKRNFEFVDLPVQINSIKLDIIEPQCDSVREVSIHKAKQAYEVLKEPVLVEDGGFCIKALNNFPGVYTKYILDTIGVEGLLELMRQKEDRRCYFISVATYLDEKGQIYSFERDYEYGKIRYEREGGNCPHAWSDIWYIYEVINHGKTLASLNREELNEFYGKSNKIVKNKGSLEKFAKWFIDNKL